MSNFKEPWSCSWYRCSKYVLHSSTKYFTFISHHKLSEEVINKKTYSFCNSFTQKFETNSLEPWQTERIVYTPKNINQEKIKYFIDKERRKHFRPNKNSEIIIKSELVSMKEIVTIKMNMSWNHMSSRANARKLGTYKIVK